MVSNMEWVAIGVAATVLYSFFVGLTFRMLGGRNWDYFSMVVSFTGIGLFAVVIAAWAMNTESRRDEVATAIATLWPVTLPSLFICEMGFLPIRVMFRLGAGELSRTLPLQRHDKYEERLPGPAIKITRYLPGVP